MGSEEERCKSRKKEATENQSSDRAGARGAHGHPRKPREEWAIPAGGKLNARNAPKFLLVQ